MRDGSEPDWPALDEGAQPAQVFGTDRFPASEAELAVDLIAPVMVYPLFESTLWARSGGTIEEHRLRLGELWASYAQVSAANPQAWLPGARSAEQIAIPGKGNRLVSLPYTKLLNSNIQTDQAAALLLCSAGTAQALGIPREQWVFPHASAHAHEHWFVSERQDLGASPAIGHAGRAALAHAGRSIDEVDRFDIYSCFPSAVQIACAELGIDTFADERPLTVTGGLTFAGGPGNNYVTHSIAAMAEKLRASGGETTGLVTSVGWYMTKHAVGVFGASPPERGFAALDVQAEVDAGPRREVAAGHEGAAMGEASTVIFDVAGTPTTGSVTALLPDRRRTLAKTHDPAALDALTQAPVEGRALDFDGAGGFAFA